MIPNLFVEISMSENDKRLLIILLVIAILLFILLGLIGMLIRYIMQEQGKRIETYLSDGVRYRVVSDPEHFKKFGWKVNNRMLYKQALVPWILGAVSLLVYILFAAITNEWGRDYWGEFRTLFYQWDWGNSDNFVNVFGLHLLAKWPDLLSAPSWHNEYWISYVLVPLWLTSIIYYLVVAQAYLSRGIAISRLARSVYNKSLDGFNYYDTLPTNNQGQPLGNTPSTGPINPPKPPLQ